MNNFTIIYKILKILEQNMGNEDFNISTISAKMLDISYNKWEQLLIMMQDEGYIKGLKIDKSLENTFRHIIEQIQPEITIKGLEYLAENNMMKKAREVAKEVAAFIP